mgnify:CR=1 FL=1
MNRLYGRAAADTFPTVYRANSAVALAALCAASGLVLESLDCVADPTYLAFNRPIYRAVVAVEDRLPAAWRIHLVGVARRAASGIGREGR